MKTLVTFLRFAVGWHFLYEGIVKLIAEKWSAGPFLSNTNGFMSGFYHWLADSPIRLQVIDYLNIWGLILIGLALFIGVFVSFSSIVGVLLLILYYFAYPPFGISLLGGDGTLFIVDKVFIETLILLFFIFTKDKGYCFDDFRKTWTLNKKFEAQTVGSEPQTPSRRAALKNLITIPALGLIGWGAYASGKKYEIDASSGATIRVNKLLLNELNGVLPKGKIKNTEISRLVMGGNLIGGWAHARDLIYAGSLFKAYNTEKKIIETLILCEEAGINTINIGFPTMSMMTKYRKLTGSKMKVIVQVGLDEKKEDIYDNVTQAIDNGMDIIQLQGNWCDWLVRDERYDDIQNILERIRSQGYIAGMGAHTIDSLIRCEERGILPDYYMKTMHHDNYWSAHPRENRIPFEVDGKLHADHNMFHDNCFCPFPDRAVEFVNNTKIPVMGFKVLAAGALSPEDGFRWAFENGADFICVGMFDFQVVEDVNTCIDILNNLPNRKRGWYA
jgi:uncharacterized membrane protein YphA (DoxX/SURF4 family)